MVCQKSFRPYTLVWFSMGLREYKRKRHFNRTPEPAGKELRRSGWSFVIQKHAASHLHYDFRLELDGVLKSWAVPKGPCLDPTVKRLAMQVEDHPVQYGSFEGIIPEGEYGGGTVMLWDHGMWEPIGDARESYRQGRLKFALHGEKLKGRWMLVRTSRGEGSEKRQWLLFKERDEEAQPLSKVDILEKEARSVTTGRTMDEIAEDRDWVWNSNGDAKKQKPKGKPARAAAKTKTAPRAKAVKLPLAKVKDAVARRMPTRIDVELATLSKEVPEGDQWLHEIKFDGYRMICRIDKGQARFITRNHKDWSTRLAFLAESAARLPVKQAIFDGEVVAMRPDGTTDFQDLQNAFSEHRAESLYYYVFDLLYVDGHDLTRAPLVERKKVLAKILGGRGIPRQIRLSEHIEGNGQQFLKQACKMRLEGIICKRGDRPYQPGRGYDWLKVKCVQTAELVIGGYSDPTGARVGLGALLLGYHDKSGDLVYAGKVGTGFDEQTLRSLLEQLSPLARETSPFANLKRGNRKTHWVEPKLVAQITFGSWTRDNILRHSVFQGLREDKPARDVTRETAVPLAKIKSRGKKKVAVQSSAERRTTAPAEAKPVETDGYDVRKKLYHGVRLTSPEKVLYPEQGITKIDLANYYRMVADWILPHIAHRPLVLVRCPEGREKECFYQKHPGSGTPTNLRRIPIKESKKTEDYVLVDDVQGLISLAQIGALEIHAWGSREDKLEYPDRLIFDLDPDPAVSWPRVVQSAHQVRDFLEELGLESFLKTTGGKGLHLVVPIKPEHDWDEAKAFCKRVADLIVAADPAHYTANMAKAARHNKIYVDYLRNGRGATAVVPYSTRARPGATVSTPLTWTELSAKTTSDRYTVRNMARRLTALKRDPWQGIDKVRQSLAGPLAKLKSLRPT